MPDLDEGLAALARHAGRTGRLEPAASIRFRADRRRRRRQSGAVAAGVVAVVALAAGIALAGSAGRPAVPPIGTPSTRPAPSTPASLPPSFAARGSDQAQTGLSYRRAYRLVPATSPQPVSGLALGAGGRFDVPTLGTDAQFTPAMVGTSPVRPEWTIRLDERDRSRCLAVQDDGTLGLATCGPSNNNQRFELRRGPLDTQDRPTYALVTRNPAAPGRLTWNPAGTRPRVTADPGPEDVQGWLFVDEGPSTLAD